MFDVASQRLEVGMIQPTETQLMRSDVAGGPDGEPDGKINVFDAIVMIQQIVGSIEITVCWQPQP